MTTLAERYAQALQQAQADGAPKAVMARFLGVVKAHGREALLPAILAAFERLEDTAAGRVRVAVTSAQPLSAAQEAKLVARVKAETAGAQEVVVTSRIDPALRAGFKAAFAGKVWDASVQRRLARMRALLN